jgi:hypothetical protein
MIQDLIPVRPKIRHDTRRLLTLRNICRNQPGGQISETSRARLTEGVSGRMITFSGPAREMRRSEALATHFWKFLVQQVLDELCKHRATRVHPAFLPLPCMIRNREGFEL